MAIPLINGIQYSWSNIKLQLFGVPVIGITEISYNRKQKKENNYGSGVEPVSRGYGNKEYDGSISIYLDEWNKIIQSASNKDPLDIPPFNIEVLFGGSSVQFKHDILRFCEFMEDPMDAKQGDTKLLVKLPLIIGAIEHKA